LFAFIIKNAANEKAASCTNKPKIRLFTLKGAEIEDTCEIVHDDMLFVVKEEDEFVYPMAPEQCFMIQGPQTRTRLATVNRRSPFRRFFDKFIPELYHVVFSFLDHQELGFTVSLVCKEWYRYANSEQVWRELCANVYYWTQRRRKERKYWEEEGSKSPLPMFIAAANANGSSSASATGMPVAASTNSSVYAAASNNNSGSNSGYNNQLMGSPFSANAAGTPTGSSSSNNMLYSSSPSASSNLLALQNFNIFSPNGSTPQSPMSPAVKALCEFNLKNVLTKFHARKTPPMYKSWKTYYRYYIMWALFVTWDTTDRGANIKFKNNNMTLFRDDNITYHWQTVRSSIPIFIPTEQQKKQNGIFDGNSDDVAIYEWELYIDCFDKTNSNGWWIVFGLETDQFTYKESTPTNLVGYDRHLGWGYASGNGDTLHCYSNQALKNRQPFTCDPIKPWTNTPYKQGDTVRARLKYYTKYHADPVDPKEYIGATLEFFLNGKYLGQAFRNITAPVVYPAVSILPNQMVTLRHCDAIADDYTC